ncbi:hypothetical protein HanHA300_Chr13g0468631 [Helianthus annuus]|nr:hypothetical protein HanHA300_Chr13g0468631 [Helianthus annuus]KAJ0496491.1 hypothetical protein HanHA89_Chr13g0500411 [Helianthus annuus]KAJ0662548.1 hypothetical protein HanLR1_Chr13g0470821 [Helianthus annuus]KAJ0670068.1 hypothetical protein HanOQP8_Chr13g0469861 [Helianthus annuus]
MKDLQVRHTSMVQQTAMDVSCVDPTDHYGSKHCGYSVSHALQVKKSGIVRFAYC